MTKAQFEQIKKKMTIRHFHWSDEEPNNVIVKGLTIQELYSLIEIAEGAIQKEDK